MSGYDLGTSSISLKRESCIDATGLVCLILLFKYVLNVENQPISKGLLPSELVLIWVHFFHVSEHFRRDMYRR